MSRSSVPFARGPRRSAGRLRSLALTLMLASFGTAISSSPSAAAPPLTASVVGEEAQGKGVFRFPQAVAVTAAGTRVFVGDQYSSVVQAFDGQGRFLFNVSSRATRGEPGRIGVVGGVAVDRSGHLYVLDAENDRVQVFSATDGHHLSSFGDRSIFNLMAGSPESGIGISASGIAVFQASPATPPIVYVADTVNDRVERFVLDPGTLLPVGDPQISNPAIGLEAPQGLTLDATGTKLYVADDVHHRVVVLTADGLGFLAQAGSYGTGPGQFQYPYDVAVDSSVPPRLYVADNLGGRVQVFDATSLAFIRTIGRVGYGSGVGQMSIIRSVGALADGPRGVYVGDTANNRIQLFDDAGAVVAAWGVAGRGPGYVTRPRGVAFMPDGGVAVADTFDQRVALYAPDGTYAGQRGLVSGITGFTFPGPATGQFELPNAVSYDTGGNLWIADTANSRVVVQNAAGEQVGISPPGALDTPRGLAPAAGGAMYVADERGGVLWHMTPSGIFTLVRDGLTKPVAVGNDQAGTPFVAETKAVRNAVTGVAVPSPEGGAWDRPAGLAFDPSGTLYVSERRPNTPNGARIVRGTPDGGGEFTWDTVAREGDGPGQVIDPAGLAVNASGTTLLVADTGNDRVLRFDLPGSGPAPMAYLVAGVNAIQRGTVTSDLPGIACATDCAQHYGLGRTVTLTARPAAGFVFSRWDGDCAAAGAASSCAVALGGDRRTTAIFDPVPVAVTRPAVATLALTRFTLKPSTLRLARAANRRLHRKAREATRARVQLAFNRPASVTVKVLVGRSGRKQGSRCRVISKANRSRKPCTRYVATNGQRKFAAAGGQKFRLSPTWSRRVLRPGKYRLSVVAAGQTGGRLAPVTRHFRVVR